MNANKTTEFRKGQTVFWWDGEDLQLVTARVEDVDKNRIYTSHIDDCGIARLVHFAEDESLYPTKAPAIDEALADLDRQIAVLHALKKSIVELHKSEES